MKNLKSFETQELCDNFKTSPGYVTPNVFLIGNDNIEFNNYVDPYMGHDYVEIGGLKWATMNIGAESTHDPGLYFAWGETQGYNSNEVGRWGIRKFKWKEYKFCNNISSPTTEDMAKYNNTDNKIILDLTDDAANINWGGKWRTPTLDDFKTLLQNVNIEYVNNYDTNFAGLLLTSKINSNIQLFFRNCSSAYDEDIWSGNYGQYWTSSLYTSDVTKSYSLNFSEMDTYFVENLNYQNIYSGSNNPRYYGLHIRPVAD